MPLAGNLATISLPNILQLLYSERKTGTLVVKDGSSQREIYLKSGVVIHAISNDSAHRIGQLLVRRKSITNSELERAIKAQRRSGQNLGDALIDLRAITREQLQEVLKIQVEEIVYNALNWERGHFEFLENKLPAAEFTLVSLNMMDLVMEGARRLDEWEKIKASLPPRDSVLLIESHPSDRTEEIRLSAEEFSILGLLNGVRNIEEICSESPAGEFVTCKTLHLLLDSGLVKTAGKKQTSAQAASEERHTLKVVQQCYEICLNRIEQALRLKIGPGWVRCRRHGLRRLMHDYPELLGDLEPYHNGGANLTRVMDASRQLNPLLRSHELIGALNGLLSEEVRLLKNLAGNRVTDRVLYEIGKEVRNLLALERGVDEQLGLKRELERVLR
ncbi:MAG TPA: DUF4388 domain-containing protein [Acidobacteriota bacterium]|jgi:hypothetical protein